MEFSVREVEKQRNKKHQVFEPSFEIKELRTEKFIRQKLNYIHKNPVSGKWSSGELTDDFLKYEHSSARFYELKQEVKCKLFHYSDILLAESRLTIL